MSCACLRQCWLTALLGTCFASAGEVARRPPGVRDILGQALLESCFAGRPVKDRRGSDHRQELFLGTFAEAQMRAVA